MRRHIVVPPEQILEGLIVPDPYQQGVDQGVEASALEAGKLNLSCCSHRPSFLQRDKSVVGAVVAAHPGRQNAAILQANRDFSGDLVLTIGGADRDGYEGQAQSDVANMPLAAIADAAQDLA